MCAQVDLCWKDIYIEESVFNFEVITRVPQYSMFKWAHLNITKQLQLNLMDYKEKVSKKIQTK